MNNPDVLTCKCGTILELQGEKRVRCPVCKSIVRKPASNLDYFPDQVLPGQEPEQRTDEPSTGFGNRTRQRISSSAVPIRSKKKAKQKKGFKKVTGQENVETKLWLIWICVGVALLIVILLTIDLLIN